MKKATILFADNDPDFLQTRAEFLTEEGFDVIPAATLESAQREMIHGRVDLAVVDIRLTNDDDEKDESGLKLAREHAPALPKIILTNYPTHELVRQSLRDRDGFPTAVDFIDKKEGPMALLHAIQRALQIPAAIEKKPRPARLREIGKRLRPVRLDVAAQLSSDYRDIQREAAANNRWRLILAILCVLVVITGVVLAFWTNNTLVSILMGAGSVITGTMAALFDKMTREANRRRDRYHEELLRLLSEDHTVHKAAKHGLRKSGKKGKRDDEHTIS